MLESGNVYGQWKFEREIGKGGFGSVLLWINQSSGDKIVIKHCLTKLDDRSRKRWNEEVKLMNENHHRNLVLGIKVPTEIIEALNAPELLLGLEFCDSDLRKVLSNVSHCCGLREKMVLGVLRDISCGLEFLHHKHIIHRDLKPENILLSHTSGGTIFKIADFGYAKQLDVVSICQSFVGTLQYLAPELYTGDYKTTADYWSFGTLLFECITGTRPFYITESASKWPNIIASKSDTDIWGYFDEQKDCVIFSSEIPSPNHICQPLLNRLQDFLQLVLRHNPELRGNKPVYPKGPLQWYAKVTHILETKILNVFDVLTCTSIVYVYQGNETFSAVKEYLQTHTNVAVEPVNQILITENGKVLDDSEFIHSYLQQNEYKLSIYLLKKNKRHCIQTILPDRVRELVGSADDVAPDPHLVKKMWSQSYYYCSKTSQDYSLLISSLQVLLLNIEENNNNKLNSLLDEISKWSVKLETSIDIYKESYNFDLRKIHIPKCNTDELNCLSNWKAIEIKMETYMDSLEIQSLKLEIQNTVKNFEKISQNSILTEQNNNLKDLAMQTEEKLKILKNFSRHKKIEDSKKMQLIVRSCIAEQENMYKSFYDILKKAMHCREDMIHIITKLTTRLHLLKDNYEQVKKWQLHRQGLLWRLFKTNDAVVEDSSDILLNRLIEMEKQHADEQSGPSLDLVVQGFTEKISRLHRMFNPKAESPKKSFMKSFTFDAFPYHGDKDKKISTDQFKRRPSEPILMYSKTQSQPSTAHIKCNNWFERDNVPAKPFQSNLSPINSTGSFGNPTSTAYFQNKDSFIQTSPSYKFHQQSHSPSNHSTNRINISPTRHSPSRHSISKPSYKVASRSEHLKSIEVELKQHSDNNSNTLTNSQQRAQLEHVSNQLQSAMKKPSHAKLPELRLYDSKNVGTPPHMYNNNLLSNDSSNRRRLSRSPNTSYATSNSVSHEYSHGFPLFENAQQQDRISPVFDKFMLPVYRDEPVYEDESSESYFNPNIPNAF